MVRSGQGLELVEYTLEIASSTHWFVIIPVKPDKNNDVDTVVVSKPFSVEPEAGTVTLERVVCYASGKRGKASSLSFSCLGSCA